MSKIDTRLPEDEIVKGGYIQRSGSERITLEKVALKRYLNEVSRTKKPSTQKCEGIKAQQLITHLGKYPMAALSAEKIASYRDTRHPPLQIAANPRATSPRGQNLGLQPQTMGGAELVFG